MMRSVPRERRAAVRSAGAPVHPARLPRSRQRARQGSRCSPTASICSRATSSAIVEHFSGGNQQKVLLAKGLSRPVKLFIFDEPTVGVDVGTRVAIYGFIRDLCESGAGVLLISSDLPEILHLTNRTYVMYRGRPAGRARRRGDHRGQRAGQFLRTDARVMDRKVDASAGCDYSVAAAAAVRPHRRAAVPPGHRAHRLHALSPRFLTSENLITVARQSTYLTIVAMGQMLALLTGGFDLSVGKIVAITSVVTALTMAPLYAAHPDATVIDLTLGILAGIGAGTFVGVVNGVGVAVFNVSPFMMTLGTASISFGIALTLTSGVPVYGLPDAFGTIFGFSRILDIPSPVYVTAGLFVAMYILLNWTRMGRYFYAVGGNLKASRLSGINTRFYLFMAYVLCGALAAVAGALLTARLETGEANIGASMPLDSIAACVIGGVSLRGGIGSVGNVVLGAIFIGLIQNGMDLAQIQSYLQEVVIGVLLILAVIADQLRQFVMLRLKD